MLNTTRALDKWRKVVTEYSIAKLRKLPTSDLVTEAFGIYKSGKLKVDPEKMSPITLELYKQITRPSTFDMIVLNSLGTLGFAVDSVRPRSGENLVSIPICKSLEVSHPVGTVVQVQASGISPVKYGKYWTVQIHQLHKVDKSARKVPNTIKEVLNVAQVEGTLFAKSKDHTLLVLNKILKSNPTPEATPEPAEKPIDLQFDLIKSNTDKQLAYGVVYEPDRVDTDGDSAGADAIEEAAHQYLADFSNINLMHEKPLGNRVRVVESYIAPVDFSIGTQSIRKGSWVMAVYIDDPKLWDAVKSGILKGFSIEGTGRPA